jgi:membrane protein DedA with SNARE-associated domain
LSVGQPEGCPFLIYTVSRMESLLHLISRHGYIVVFVVVLAEAIGLPLPAAIALVGAGAAVASKVLRAHVVLPLAISAMLLGDSLLYILGRHMGWMLLGILCKVSINPETCILRSAESFYKRGKMTLLFAKFIPGVNTMAPPLAGSMKMRFDQFIRLDFLGAALYTCSYFVAGYLFRDFLMSIVHGFQSAGHAIEAVLAVAAVLYAGYRTWLYGKYSMYKLVPKVQVQELAKKLSAEGSADKVLLVDVRSHGYYDENAERIKGSIRLEPNNLEDELKNLPKGKDIYLYCT